MFRLWSLGRKEQLVLLVILVALLFGGGYRYGQYKSLQWDQPELVTTERGDQDEVIGEILVHVSGAVEKPGVYTLPEGSRWIDAIKLAVPTEQADLHRLNLAAVLSDGQKIPVPTVIENEATSPDVALTTDSLSTNKVNINTASIEELNTLSGIGPALAQRIIEYRQVNGDFKSIEEIKNVSGIGEKKYQAIKDFISTY